MIGKKQVFIILAVALGASWFFRDKSTKQEKLDTLVIAWDTVPKTYDPRFANGAQSQYLEDLVHCSLFGFDPEGTLIKELAQEWKWLDDKTLTLEISEGKLFSDGTPVTASHVKQTYDYFLKDHKGPVSPRRGAYLNLVSVEELGKTGVIFHLKKPEASFLTNLTVGILSDDALKEEMIDGSKKLPSCGPFTLDAVDLSKIYLKKNIRFNISQLAQMENLVIKIVKDETTRFSKLRKGEVDIVQNGLNYDKVAKISEEYKDLKIQKKPGLKTTYIGFNLTDSTLSHLEVRKAISQAINRDAIIEHLLKNMAVKASTILPPGHEYFLSGLRPDAFNPENAKKLLDAGGFPMNKELGYRFKLTYKTTYNQTRLAIANTIASDLSKIGIKVDVLPLEWGRFKSDVDQGHVQLWGLSWIGFKDPDIYYYAFAKDSFPPSGANRGRFDNSELNQLLAKGQSTIDLEERKKIYKEVQKIVNEQLPYVFLFHEENFAVMGRNIHGFQLYADGRYASLKNVTKESRPKNKI